VLRKNNAFSDAVGYS